VNETTAGLASATGDRVRAERTPSRWTLDRLAEVAVLRRRMPVAVDLGTGNPGVGTLRRFGAALGAGLPGLVEQPHPDPARDTSSGHGAILWSGEHGGRGVLVAGTDPPAGIELRVRFLGPGDRHTGEAHPSVTEDLVHIVVGVLTIAIADESITLDGGDAGFGDPVFGDPCALPVCR
jgi:hypothetical protein